MTIEIFIIAELLYFTAAVFSILISLDYKRSNMKELGGAALFCGIAAVACMVLLAVRFWR